MEILIRENADVASVLAARVVATKVTTDSVSRLSWAVDLTHLVQASKADVENYLQDTIQRIITEQIARWRSAA